MFNEFMENGSIIAFVCMAYMNTVQYEIMNAKQAMGGLNVPRILQHPFSKFIQLIALPCLFWPAIYVGLFSGWGAGVISWVAMLSIGGMMAIPLGIKRNVGFHIIPASVAMFIGYYISFTSIP